MTPPLISDRPILFAADLRAGGVERRDIAAAIDEGRICRAARGVYVMPEVYIDQDLEPALASHKTGGVVGLLSAAVRHGLCDAVPPVIQILVGWGEVRRAPADMPVKVFRTRDEQALTIGVDAHDFHGLTWFMTDAPRTVVDLYRVKPDAWRQHAVASLATFLRDGGDERLLREYATAFGVWDRLESEVDAINEAYARGMRK